MNREVVKNMMRGHFLSTKIQRHNLRPEAFQNASVTCRIVRNEIGRLGGEINVASDHIG